MDVLDIYGLLYLYSDVCIGALTPQLILKPVWSTFSFVVNFPVGGYMSWTCKGCNGVDQKLVDEITAGFQLQGRNIHISLLV